MQAILAEAMGQDYADDLAEAAEEDKIELTDRQRIRCLLMI